MERVQALMRERLAWQDRLVAPVLSTVAPRSEAPAVAVALREKSVLCVSEDAMALMLTRKVVEMAGGRCQGRSGKEDADTLEASLVAADLVICQTGCVSHGAYWRVRDHCTRTGKECVLVDRPEALDGLRPTETAGADGAVGAGSVRASRPRRPRAAQQRHRAQGAQRHHQEAAGRIVPVQRAAQLDAGEHEDPARQQRVQRDRRGLGRGRRARAMCHMMAALLPASVKHCSSCRTAMAVGSAVIASPVHRIAVITAEIRISRGATRASTLGAAKKNSTSLATPTTHNSDISAVDGPWAVQCSVE